MFLRVGVEVARWLWEVARWLWEGLLLSYSATSISWVLISPLLGSQLIFFPCEKMETMGQGTWLDHSRHTGFVSSEDPSCLLPCIEHCLAVQLWGSSGVRHTAVSKSQSWSSGTKAHPGDPFPLQQRKVMGACSRKGQLRNLHSDS